jgi:hypothetical protein
MSHPRLASTARPAREPWPVFDDDEEQAPFEEWALDEVDSDFALLSSHELRVFDASFD